MVYYSKKKGSPVIIYHRALIRIGFGGILHHKYDKGPPKLY